MKKIKIFGGILVVLLVTAIGTFAAVHKTGPIESALQAKAKADALHLRANNVGLSCGSMAYDKDCAELTARAEKNPELKTALLKVQAADVSVYTGTLNPFVVGEVREGYIRVNTWYGDQKIIAYLTAE